MSRSIKPDRTTWRHYFGGFTMLALMVQLLTGIFLALYYEPSLKGAYRSVQYITNEVTGGSLLRNLHRWIAFVIFLAVFIHTVRTTLRKDFLNPEKRVLWLTGVVVMLPIFVALVTGLILPWEWKGYWLMEMVPNYFGALPLVGDGLKRFFLESFTLPRYEVLHILVLPLITFILLDYHFITRLRRRGIFRYMARHLIASSPLWVGLVVLSIYITIPSQDPEMIPMPLEGQFIPAPEWWALLILLPFMYLEGILVPALSFLLPLVVWTVAALLPCLLARKEVGTEEEREPHHATPHHRARGVKLLWHRLWRGGRITKIARAVVVTVIFLVFFSLVYLGSYNSPTLGCNSCHNLNNGFRMGMPPEDFKDRTKLPYLDDNEWMMGHWFYPQEIY